MFVERLWKSVKYEEVYLNDSVNAADNCGELRVLQPELAALVRTRAAARCGVLRQVAAAALGYMSNKPGVKPQRSTYLRPDRVQTIETTSPSFVP